MSYWNYRLVKKTFLGLPPNLPPETCFELYAFYYNEDGDPIAMSVNPASPFGLSVEELKRDLDLLLDAFNKPVYTVEDLKKLGLWDEE